MKVVDTWFHKHLTSVLACVIQLSHLLTPRVMRLLCVYGHLLLLLLLLLAAALTIAGTCHA